jgi:hypothetical protein
MHLSLCELIHYSFYILWIPESRMHREVSSTCQMDIGPATEANTDSSEFWQYWNNCDNYTIDLKFNSMTPAARLKNIQLNFWRKPSAWWTLGQPRLLLGFHETTSVKGNGVATLAQNKIFPAKQELLLSEITGLPLDAQMQRNRLDVDERVEGSRQCSCSRPSWLARAARPIQVLQMQHLQGIHTYGEGSDARRTARSASATRRERWQRGC